MKATGHVTRCLDFGVAFLPSPEIERREEMTYEEFKTKYKKYHTCGFPFISYELSYDSACPKCAPQGVQWEVQCKQCWESGCTTWGGIQGWI